MKNDVNIKIDKGILGPDERIAVELRSLYSSLGYERYKMGKFEEYALYVRNKDFLVSDGIISFTDTRGRLLALKPDVTLSIINNSADEAGRVQRLYYDENVYRISKNSHTFKEIRQTGVECIGDITVNEECEVLLLALKSLEGISDDYALEISHVGLLEAVISELIPDEIVRNKVVLAISAKNNDETERAIASLENADEAKRVIGTLSANYTSVESAKEAIAPLCTGESARKSFEEFAFVLDVACRIGREDKIRVNFSLTSGVRYYSGLVFKGYIKGVPTSVLSGGRYDRLMKRMKRSSGAAGFAVYLDELERFDARKSDYDVDVLIITGNNVCASLAKAEELTAKGYTVRLSEKIPEDVRYKELISFEGEGK